MKTIDISKELQEQDNLATADPYWVIRDWQKIPTTSDYSDKYYWYMDEGEYSDEELKELLTEENIVFNDENFEEVAKEHEWNKIYYIEIHVDKGVWFTHKACKQHLEAKRHHYSEKAYTYCHSLYSCHEVREIRDLLLQGEVGLTKTNVKEK